MTTKLTAKEIAQRQNAAVKHGGEAAIERIRDGKPFTGLAHDEEVNVRNQLESVGRSEIVKENAIRLQVATNLFWNAVQKAVEDGDLDALDRYVSRFGWLASATLRAWGQVKQDQGNQPGVTAGMVIDSLKKDEENE